jgi:hypothetical protein
MSTQEILESRRTNEDGTKTIKLLNVNDSHFQLEYMHSTAGEEGLFFTTGLYATREEAEAKANELFVAELISGEMIAGTVEA